jgi:hypothetical protein
MMGLSSQASKSNNRGSPGLTGQLQTLLNPVQPEHNTKLYKSDCLHDAAAAVTRHRGKSPRQYETYLELHAPVSISFEHAWLLLLALRRHDEVGVARCEDCGSLRLRDLLARHKQTCGICHLGSPPALTH